LDGILNVAKPAGITSYGVVARIKRLTGEKRVGHTGTLDPDATGVLPVCLGRATRVVPYLAEATKTYLAAIELGIATDTYDAAGKIMQRGDTIGITPGQIEAALKNFRGAISQTPPMYSAVKHRGQPLYKLARAGVSIERKSRMVTINLLKIVDWQPPLVTLEIDCGKGTYIRSLAHDLGQALGCGAYLKELVRTRCGVFGIESSVSLSQLEEAARENRLESLLYPVDYPLQGYRAVVIDKAAEKAMKQGSTLAPELIDIKDNTTEILCRVYATDGRFLGLLRYAPGSGRWQPEKVFV
jgi:tRNA pseudouridine55 synthase